MVWRITVVCSEMATAVGSSTRCRLQHAAAPSDTSRQGVNHVLMCAISLRPEVTATGREELTDSGLAQGRKK